MIEQLSRILLELNTEEFNFFAVTNVIRMDKYYVLKLLIAGQRAYLLNSDGFKSGDRVEVIQQIRRFGDPYYYIRVKDEKNFGKAPDNADKLTPVFFSNYG